MSRVLRSIATLACALACALCLTWGASPAHADEPSQAPTLAEVTAEKVLPSVGSVYCVVDSGHYVSTSQGSCVVVDASGLLVTNYHVVEGAAEVAVRLNGEYFAAQIVGSDPSGDVAVIKIDPGATELVPIAIGDSSKVKIGQWVMTLGTPYGESETVSMGIVSGLDRVAYLALETTEVYYAGLIQTDAMINSGSSGGALVNADGEFIGVTSLSMSLNDDWAGMSYAIPSNYAMDVVRQITEKGYVEHPRLGIVVAGLLDLEDFDFEDFSLLDEFTTVGVRVLAVEKGSPSEAAGLRVDDVILAVGDDDVYFASDVMVALRNYAVGDQATLSVLRSGKTLEVQVTLGSDYVPPVEDAGQDEEASAAPLPFQIGPSKGLFDEAA